MLLLSLPGPAINIESRVSGGSILFRISLVRSKCADLCCVVLRSGKRPCITERPDYRLRYCSNCFNASETICYPVQVDNVRFAGIDFMGGN